ncbi:dinuclear metal center YbgI/SA1388 family protein [Bacilli bacterium PM5-9]|nr:dinuclear metal center YbgI/SA1388 family protein [Bacilli bacterium PM5-9]
MKLNNLLNEIEKKYPQTLQEEWDSSGLIINNEDVSKILVCLDVTSNVLDYAKTNNFDLIISHHPLIFMDYCLSYDYIRDIFQNAYASKISLYSMHTNFDNHNLGMNDLFVKKLDYLKNDSNNMLVTFNVDDNLYLKLSKVCHDKIRVYNKKDNPKKAAVVLGAGGSFLEEIKILNCDVFISSEFKHHEILYAIENNITLIDVSHQAEMIFVDEICEYLKNNYNELEIEGYQDYYSISDK